MSPTQHNAVRLAAEIANDLRERAETYESFFVSDDACKHDESVIQQTAAAPTAGAAARHWLEFSHTAPAGAGRGSECLTGGYHDEGD